MARLLRSVLSLLLARHISAQFGGGIPADALGGSGSNDVDRAMAGWAQLSQNPDKMADLMEAFKDPEVVAKAQEMLKDPVYMEAAKAKLAHLENKAKSQGLLDANGQPVEGNMDMLRMADMMKAGMGSGAGSGAESLGGATDFELENMARHRAGELNTAELGMANMKASMKDPSILREVAKMMQDPNTMREVQNMMADPTFKQQAQQMMQKMKGDGSLDEINAAMRKAKDVMAGGGFGGQAAEMLRLQQENAMLKQQMGMKAEL